MDEYETRNFWPEIKCKAATNGIKEVYFINDGDWTIEDGQWRMKRKYGKFTRPVIKARVNRPQENI